MKPPVGSEQQMVATFRIRRRYGDGDLRRLRFIRSAQAAGFTLAQTGELLSLDAVEDHARARALAEERIAARDAKIAEMRVACDALSRRLSAACADGSTGDCPILSAFER